VQLTHAIEAFYQEVSQTFTPLESFCDSEARRHIPLKEQLDKLDSSVGAIKAQLG